jgi:Tfp pilus assembly protein PilF
VLFRSPGNAEAHNNLGALLVQSGAADEGIAHLREALRLRPDFEDARDSLAAALGGVGAGAGERR